jgi:hypothetical protein
MPHNEEYVEEFNLGLTWDTGAPAPILICNDYDALLAFNEPGDNTDLDHPINPVAVVYFSRCLNAMLGSPDENTLPGHRLWGHGLGYYGAFVVHNSSWIAELKRVNNIDSDSAAWDDYVHYIFTFHDSTFECIAESFSVKSYVDSDELPAILR